MSDHAALLAQVSNYYGEKLHDHGPTPRGVDWNTEESQVIRFQQLMRVHEGDGGFEINDYGCGYGALIDYLRAKAFQFSYTGYDIARPMIEQAQQIYATLPYCHFLHSDDLQPADYTVASGIFNVRFAIPDPVWHDYMLRVIETMWAASRSALAFNALTSYSDHDKRRPDLFYADPTFLFDYCKRHLSRNVVLLHDYNLWEFTIIVRR
ncbi:MAG: class I SAM-dependent methyltransferase [Chloroflexota bacterium]